MNHRRLIVNLASVSSFPTGLSTVARNLVPHLDSLRPIVLARSSQVTEWQEAMPDSDVRSIPDNMSSDDGRRGHFRRLRWIEGELSSLVRNERGVLLSPVPEAPLVRRVRSIVIVFDFIPLVAYPRTHPLFIYSKWYVPSVVGQAQLVMGISEATIGETAEICKVTESIAKVSMGVDHHVFRQHIHSSGRPLRQFVYVGRVASYKNVESAVRAFCYLGRPDLDFVLAGPPDPEFERLVSLARTLGSDRVRYVGVPTNDRLAELYQQSLALVFLSTKEGFGLPVLEAMACGTAVICSNVSAVREAAGGAAILVPPHDIPAIAAAMGNVADDQEMRNRLVREGLEHSSSFTWAASGRAFGEVVRRQITGERDD